MRAAPDLVGALEWFVACGSVQGAQVWEHVADEANAPTGGRSGAARLKAGWKGKKNA